MEEHFQSVIQLICIALIPLIFAITLHEAAHGYIASKFGDKTALMLGRVTLNPAKHIDPIGTVILPLLMMAFGGVIFGWAKPVPIDWRNLKKPRRDAAIIAIAGPGANFLMAIFWGLIAKLSHLIFATPALHAFPQAALFFHLTSRFGIMINCVLLVINLIPIPPLDGSRIVASFLPPQLAAKYESLAWYGLWIFLGFILLLSITGLMGVLWWPINALVETIYGWFGLPLQL